MQIEGRTLIRQWIDVLVKMVKGTWAITSAGGMFGMVLGLMLFAVVMSVAIIPLLVLTVLYLGQKGLQAVSGGRE